MKIIETVIREIKIERIKDILCNRYGGSCRIECNEDEDDGPDAYGLIEASVSGGCHSSALEDLKTYTFSLCEGCLVEVFKDFKIAPQQHSCI